MNVTQLIKQYRQGDKQSSEQLFAVVYPELRRIAEQQLRRSWGMETIQTTALVNEAYLKLIDQNQCDANDRAHFFALSATAMRQIIINYAEHKQAKKRGGDWVQSTFSEADLQQEQQQQTDIDSLIMIDKALASLADIDQDLAQLVELRFFAGMTEAEIALVFEVTERTVRRNWRKAKALMATILNQEAVSI